MQLMQPSDPRPQYREISSTNLGLKARTSFARTRPAIGGLLFVALLFTSGSAFGQDQFACSDDNSWARANLNATAWVQTSAEYRGLALSAYNTAKAQIDKAIADTKWTALPEQVGEKIETLPLAIILDVDETVLDNFAYQAWAVLKKKEWSLDTWNEWIRESRATAVPGSREFIEYAREKGVNFFYLTNRDFEDKVKGKGDKNLEIYTVDNLKDKKLLPKQEFPRSVLNDDGDVVLNGEVLNNVVLMRGEKEGVWGSEKTSRRTLFLKHYRVILLIGDSLGDFIGYKGEDFYKVFEPEAMREELEKYHYRWGKSWIILPNPTYGSWERSLYDFEDDLAPGCKAAMKEERLTPWVPK